MRRLALEAWTRRSSALHRCDARSKLVTCLLLCVAARYAPWSTAAALVAGLVLSRLPLAPFLLRLGAILTFAAALAATTALSGDAHQALILFRSATLSACAVLLLIATTRFDTVLDALRWFRVPHALVDTIWFVQRYISVLTEQAARMHMAAIARGSSAMALVSAAQLGVLFNGARDRSQRVHYALVARGWTGGPLNAAPGFRRLAGADYALLAIGVANLIFAIRPW